MKDSTRLIINTFAQNVRTIINILLSLVSTRIVLEAMGQSDYGVYMLIAGIVSLLSYLNNALAITTQRHLSYNFGSKDSVAAKLIFENSLLLHVCIGIVLSLLGVSVISLIFDSNFLTISADKVEEAKGVYLLVVASVLLTIVTSPYKALLLAKENIVYLSIVDVLDGVLKCSLVLLLPLFESNRLVIYAAILTGVMLFHFCALSIYCVHKFSESTLLPNVRAFDRKIQQELLGFASWTLYGMLCVYARMQGVAVVLNKVFSNTIINSAFGIGTQVFGSVQFLSEAVLNAFRPQIIKAEGAGNRSSMLLLSQYASKYSFLLLAVFVVPLIFEMPDLLALWLGEVPEYSVLFCRVLLLTSLADQLTTGLGVANAAIGKIRNYTLVVFSIKALTIPAIYLGFVFGYPIEWVMMFYMLFELIAAFVRIPYIIKTAGLRFSDFMKNVILNVITPSIVMTVVGFALLYMFVFQYAFVVNIVLNVLIGMAAVYFFSLDGKEKVALKELVNKRLHR